MLIDIISDTICPWCFIGKRRLEKALAESGRNDIFLAWRPFQLNPDMPPDGMGREAYLRAKFGGGDRPKQIYDAIGQTGREVGIDFRFDLIRKTPNTVNSHRLIHWSGPKGRQDAVVESLFAGYFGEGLDVSDVDTLVEIAARSGIEAAEAREFIESDELKSEVVSADVYARRLGIQGVPCFIVDRKYAVSGAQPPSAFLEVFRLAGADETATAQADATSATTGE
jgi:predicted DsbA family dithiol-disulfide isomerase